jgi:hypothetical protein
MPTPNPTRRRPSPHKPDPIAEALAPVTDPHWRRWLERLLREGDTRKQDTKGKGGRS